MAGNENLKQAGIYLVVMGREEFLKALNDANNATKSFTEATKRTSEEFNRFTTGSMAGAVALGTAIYNMATQAVGQLINVGKQAVFVRGRFDELAGVARLLAQNQGYTAKETDDLIASVRSWGIEADVAANLVTEFTRYNLDLAKAQDLARVAQDAAVVSGSNSSDTLRRLLWGVTTYNTMVLKTAGIQVNANKAWKEAEKELGKNASMMSANERSAAMLNAVLAEGAKIAGSYTTAMESPYKLMGSYKRVLNDLFIAIGGEFQPAFLNVMQTITQFTTTLTKAIEGGGVLAGLFRNMGSIATLLTGAVENLSLAFSNDLINGINTAVDKIGRFVSNALDWGFNLISNFAQGIIDGAGSTLTAAMNYVADIIGWFLESHSPPRAIPNLPTWGQKAMESYLHGFLEADFSVLGQLSGIFSSALGSLAAIGSIGKDTAANAMYSFQQNLVKVMATGKGEASFLKRLGSMFGSLGNEIVSLTKKSLEYARALREIEAATKAFEQAQKDERQAIEKINRLMDDYNKMVREGASEEEKAAKMREFKEAKGEMTDARTRMDAAQQEAEAKSEGVDKLREELSLQQQIVQQLVEMNRLQAQILSARQQMGGAGRGGIAMPEEEPPQKEEGGLTQIKTRSDDSLTWADELMKKLPVFTPVIEKLETQINGLQTAWENLSLVLKPFYETYLKPVFDAISESGIVGDVVKTAGAFMGFAFVIKGLIAVGGAIIGILGSVSWILLGIATVVAIVKKAWEGNWGGVRESLTTLWLAFIEIFDGLRTKIAEFIENVSGGKTSTINWMAILEGLKTVIGWIITVLGTVVFLVASFIVWVIKAGLAVYEWSQQFNLLNIIEIVGTWVNGLKTKIINFLREAWSKIISGFERFVEIGKEVLDFILTPIRIVLDAIKDAAAWVAEKFGLVKDALSELKLPDWLTPGSPTPLETGIEGIATKSETWATSMQLVQEAFALLDQVVRYLVNEGFVKLASIWADILMPTLAEFSSFLAYVFQPNMKMLYDYLLAEAIPTSIAFGDVMFAKIVSPFQQWAKLIVNIQVFLVNLDSFLRRVFIGVVGAVHSKMLGLANAFGAAAGAALSLARSIDAVTEALKKLAEQKAGLANPGSPSPLEISFRGISSASRNASSGIRAVAGAMRNMARIGSVSNNPYGGASGFEATSLVSGRDVAQRRAPVSNGGGAVGGDTNYNVEVQANYTNPQIPQTISNDIYTALQLVRL